MLNRLINGNSTGNSSTFGVRSLQSGSLTSAKSEKTLLMVLWWPKHSEHQPGVVREVCPHEESRVLVIATQFAQKLLLDAFGRSLV